MIGVWTPGFRSRRCVHAIAASPAPFQADEYNRIRFVHVSYSITASLGCQLVESGFIGEKKAESEPVSSYHPDTTYATGGMNIGYASSLLLHSACSRITSLKCPTQRIAEPTWQTSRLCYSSTSDTPNFRQQVSSGLPRSKTWNFRQHLPTKTAISKRHEIW